MTILANMSPAQSAEFNAALLASGGDGVARRKSAGRVEGRPTLLLFGNSEVAQSNIALALFTSTFPAPEQAAGGVTYTVANSALFTVGDKVSIALYTGEVFNTTVTALPSGTTITFADKIPKMLRAGAYIRKYTSVRASGIWQNLGPISAALSLLGNPVSTMQGYGYGGGLAADMLADLALWLKRVRPDYVMLQFLENDLGNAVPATMVLRTLRAAIRLIQGVGSTPIVLSPMPSTDYNTDAKNAAFDVVRAYVLNTVPTLFPGCAVVNVSDLYLDTSNPLRRVPLAGWTDGIHPVSNRKFTIGASIADQLRAQNVLPTPLTPAVLADMAYSATTADSNPLLVGTGGGKTGNATFTDNGFATGWVAGTAGRGTGLNVTLSKTASDGQRIQIEAPGASDNSTGQMEITRTLTLNTAMRGGAAQRMLCMVRFDTAVNLGAVQFTVSYSGSENYAAFQEADTFSANAVPSYIGKVLTVETPPMPIPEGATTVTMTLAIRPLTLASPSGFVADAEIIFMGMMPADQPVRGSIVLP